MDRITRRHALRLGVLGVTLLGTSRGVAQLAAAQLPTLAGDTEFFELYKGRWIRGILSLLGGVRVPRVFIDEVELHLMRMDTGRYTTPLNHYQTFGTPRGAARAAVDGLNGARLLPSHR
jgi:hypothetical protein